MKLTIPSLTITLPSFWQPRSWRWALLPLVAALALMWAQESAPPAGAGVGPGIFIQKLDRATGLQLAGSCYSVRNTSQVELFTVCDNNFQTASASDIDPTVGRIFVAVVPGTYHVVEIKAPPGYNLKTGKLVCVVNTFGGCDGSSLQFQDDLKVPPTVTPLPPSQININKIAVYVPPKSCYQVENSTNTIALFNVCDNNWQGAPATNTVCTDPGAVCSDVDPVVGSIRVNIVGGAYSILEKLAPPYHTLDPNKYGCIAITAKCDITVIDRPIMHPWHPWDIANATGSGPDGLVRINDIVAVVNHYYCDKALTAATPTPMPQPNC